MNTLQRHILKRASIATAIVYLVVVAIFTTTQILNEVALFIASSAAAAKSLLFAALLLPQLTVVLLPLAFVLGTIAVLSMMNGDGELVAVEASGGGRAIVAVPIYTLGAAVAAICLALSIFVEPLANRQIPALMNISGSDIMRSAAGASVFRSFGDGFYFWMGEDLPGGTPGGIFVADTRDSSSQLIYMARQASFLHIGDKDLLVLNDGVRQERNARGGKVLSISFQTYAVDLSKFTFGPFDNSLQPRNLPTAALFSTERKPSSLKGMQAQLRAELHRRLSDWLYALAFAAIAVYFAPRARSYRGSRIGTAAAGIGIALLLRGFGFIMLGGSGTNEFMAALCYAGPLFTVGLLASLGIVQTIERSPQTPARSAWRSFAELNELSARPLEIASYHGGRP